MPWKQILNKPFFSLFIIKHLRTMQNYLEWYKFHRFAITALGYPGLKFSLMCVDWLTLLSDSKSMWKLNVMPQITTSSKCKIIILLNYIEI